MAATRNHLGRLASFLLLASSIGSESCTTSSRDVAKTSNLPNAGAPPEPSSGSANPSSGQAGSSLGGTGASTTIIGPVGANSSGGSAVTGAGSYATEFNLNESPLSEGGKWKHNGLDWTTIITSDGLAFGTQRGAGGFDDSYAYLAGTFPANQSGSAVIHLESGIVGAYQEVEILLRWTDTDHTSTGYECNLAFNGQYAEIIRWPGPIGKQKSDFKFISSGNPVAGGVHDGDTFQCDVIGNVITSRLNGKVIATGSDTTIASGGAPGIGFYAEGAPASRKYSFTKFTGTGL